MLRTSCVVNVLEYNKILNILTAKQSILVVLGNNCHALLITIGMYFIVLIGMLQLLSGEFVTSRQLTRRSNSDIQKKALDIV